jgi:hypothetical protein
MVYQPIENYGNLSVGGFLKDGVETHQALLEAGIGLSKASTSRR